MAGSLKHIGLNLLPKKSQVGLLCLSESRRLQTKHLADKLGGISNALQYMGLVLWSISGTDHKGKGTKKFLSNCLLSRRIFSIQKELTLEPLDDSDFSEWYESVQQVLQETQILSCPDVQYVHGRLARALSKFDTVRADIHQIDSLLEEEPKLFEE